MLYKQIWIYLTVQLDSGNYKLIPLSCSEMILVIILEVVTPQI